MDRTKVLTEAEKRLIIARVQTVKDAGFGKIEITIQQGEITYIFSGIGEQMTLQLKN